MTRIALLFATTLTTAISGCATGAPSVSVEDGGLTQRCRTVDGNERIAIKAYDGNAVSVCAVGGEADCLYTRESGKTFKHATPDLNADGRADAVIKDFTSAYGQHDVVHFMVFAQCNDASYVKVADDMLQDVSIALTPGNDGWKYLEVTRACFNNALGDTQTRHFRLGFDRRKFRYGPPDDDSDLAEFCSAKELALPAATNTPD